MTPLEFERWFEPETREALTDQFPSAPLSVEEGDTVGVILLGAGGPTAPDEVETALYARYMDPLRTPLPVEGRLRHWLCRAAARVRSGHMRETYELIGGGTPMPRLARDQADRLQRHLSDRYGTPTGVEFLVRVGMRYGPPSIDAAAAQLAEADVNQIVLLPLYPQYANPTSGSMLAYWRALGKGGERPQWPVTAVTEYAAHPKYVRALSERISEGLQRFDRTQREAVHLLFSAHGGPRDDKQSLQDPYCCQVHATVDQVLRHRSSDRPHHVAFREDEGPWRNLRPSTTEALQEIVDDGGRAVLVVPISVLTDHWGTRYMLDMAVRNEAEARGIERYEVASALNTHPLCTEVLGEAAVAQLSLPVNVDQLRIGGQGGTPAYPLCPPGEAARVDPDRRLVRCANCTHAKAPRQWGAPQDET